jgi:hypothetical protein
MTDELRRDRLMNAPLEIVFDTFTAEDGHLAFHGPDDPGPTVESHCDQPGFDHQRHEPGRLTGRRRAGARRQRTSTTIPKPVKTARHQSGRVR